MQAVTNNWMNEHKKYLLNESYVEVSLDIADPDALADVRSYDRGVEDNGAIYISNPSEVVSEVDKKFVPYCTLEQNIWVLDGGRKAIPEDNYGDSGYVGDALSDEVCVFSSKVPTLTLNFTRVFYNPIPGVTITWSATYGEFAEDFVVLAYLRNQVVAQKEVNGNHSIQSIVEMDITTYDRIVIMVKKWCLPHHRARIEEVFAGMRKVYSKTQLLNYSHTQSVDPISTALPKTEIKFSVDNVDGEYNPHNPQGIAKYLIERQEVKVRYGLKLNDGLIEWIKGGVFYLSEWEAKQNGISADFVARDLLEFMSTIYIDNHDLSQRSLYDIAEMVLTNANLPLNSDGTVKWRISESLKNIYTYAPLPRDTLANCLQLIANRGKGVLYQDRDGILRIESFSLTHFPQDPKPTGYVISSFNSYSKSEISLTKPIAGVDLNMYSHKKDEKGITSTHEWTYDEIWAQGEHIVIDNPLFDVLDFSDNEFYDIATWVYKYLKGRMILKSSVRADVSLDALDLIEIENDYNTNAVIVTDVEFKYNGAFRGTCEGRVIEHD